MSLATLTTDEVQRFLRSMGNTPPTRVSEPRGPSIRPWAIWDFDGVALQATFSSPEKSKDGVRLVALSVYDHPEQE